MSMQNKVFCLWPLGSTLWVGEILRNFRITCFSRASLGRTKCMRPMTLWLAAQLGIGRLIQGNHESVNHSEVIAGLDG